MNFFSSEGSIETLKCLLDSLLNIMKDFKMTHIPSKDSFSINSLKRIRSICNCQKLWMHNKAALKWRLEDTNKRLDDMFSLYWSYSVDASISPHVRGDNRRLTFEKIHQVLDINDDTFRTTIQELYYSYQSWIALCKSFRSLKFTTNLR